MRVNARNHVRVECRHARVMCKIQLEGGSMYEIGKGKELADFLVSSDSLDLSPIEYSNIAKGLRRFTEMRGNCIGLLETANKRHMEAQIPLRQPGIR